jgi:hypothetical protein
MGVLRKLLLLAKGPVIHNLLSLELLAFALVLGHHQDPIYFLKLFLLSRFYFDYRRTKLNFFAGERFD